MKAKTNTLFLLFIDSNDKQLIPKMIKTALNNSNAQISTLFKCILT